MNATKARSMQANPTEGYQMIDFKPTTTWGMLVSECGNFAAFIGDAEEIDLYYCGRHIGSFPLLSAVLTRCEELTTNAVERVTI